MSRNTISITLKTEGMMCNACEMLIESALGAVEGVVEARADYARETTSVTYDANRVGLDELLTVIEQAGYEASVA